MTDQEALTKYAATRDAEAFRLLVEQYQRMVYSAVHRRLGQSADVDDVVQQTFLKLATGARSIRRDLAGWLYTTAMNGANDLIRRDRARQRHEASAAMRETAVDALAIADWEKLSRLIDETILELSAADQSLIVEHYFCGRSQRNLGAELGISQSTVMRRIERAVEELRTRLSRHELSLGGGALATALGKMAAASVPAQLTAELMKVGLSGVSGGSGWGGIGAAWIKAGLAGVTMAAVAGAIVVLSRSQAPGPAAPAMAVAATPATTAPADYRTTFYREFALGPNENLRFLPPPPLPERQRWLREVDHDDVPMPFVQWRWNNGKLERGLMVGGGPDGAGLGAVVTSCTGLDQDHISMEGFPPINANGDWIVRGGAGTQDILNDLRTIVRQHFNVDLTAQKIEVTKDALVATGKYHLKKIPGVTAGDLQFYTDVLDHPKRGESIRGGGFVNPAATWSILSGSIGIPIVDQTQQEPRKINWLMSWSMDKAAMPEGRKQLLQNITDQTGITFTPQKHTFVTWKIVGKVMENPAPSAATRAS